MKRLLIALTFFAHSAFALIGDNEKQIESRYGQPKKVVEERGKYRAVGYAAHGFAIIVGFVDGISKRETFWLLDKSPFTEDAVKQVLAFSADKGQTWRGIPPLPNGDPCWGRSDGKAMAVSATHQHFVNVNDITFVEPE